MAQTLPPERSGPAADPDLVAWRSGLDGAVANGMFDVDPSPEPVTIGGVPALRFLPRGKARGILLHFHGGGFRLGRPEQVAPFAAALAMQVGVTVICPRYRLAPEHPFPAALNDARAIFAALQEAGACNIVISGDSAGGGLAAGLAALAGAVAIPPLGLVLLSPWLDMTLTNPSFETNAASDPLFSLASAMSARTLYLKDVAPIHPLASPGLGDVAAYPPTFLNVGGGEVLADDTLALHARLQASGRAVELQIVSGMEHVAVTRGGSLKGSLETFAAIVAFLDRVLPAWS